MSKFSKTRYKEAITYIGSVDSDLATAVRAAALGRENKLGAMIALGGDSFNADKNQRLATRGLLLCIAAFFSKPHGHDDAVLEFYLNEARKRYKPKSKSQVDAEYAFFKIDRSADIDGLVQAAMNVKSSGLIEIAPFRRRDETNVGPSPICYDGVFNWLYAAGFISRRWLAATHIHAATVHQHLGDGQVITPDKWHKIERGYIWNIHKKTGRDTCHWGLSLGGGRAVACNNTSQNKVNYENDGKDTYGIFDFVELCDILETTEKYRGVDLKVGEAVEGKVKAASADAPQPRGSFITVRKYNPLRGRTDGIYY